jgi:hypothetical protein
MAMGIRSWASARIPHGEQHTKSTVVSIVITTRRILPDLEHPEAVESQQPLGEADTVVHRQGSSLAAFRQRQRWRGP